MFDNFARWRGCAYRRDWALIAKETQMIIDAILRSHGAGGREVAVEV